MPLDPSFIHDAMPLAATLGLEAATLEPEAVEMFLDWRAELCTIGGALHGGALMTLADTAGGTCAFLNLPAGASGTSTIESKTNFMGAVREGRVRAVARPLHVGSSTIVVETELRDGSGRLVAKTIQTQTVLRSSR